MPAAYMAASGFLYAALRHTAEHATILPMNTNPLDTLRIFCSAAESGNFRQTALALGISPQAVGRAIAGLERASGEALFIRNTRTCRITPFGESLYHEARQALAGMDAFLQQINRKAQSQMHGLVRVDVPQTGQAFDLLTPVLQGLRDYPGITLDWRSGNRYSQTEHEQIDVGVRIGALPDNRFIVRSIAPVRLISVIAPELAARRGIPANVLALQHDYPLAIEINRNTGKAFPWHLQSGSFIPAHPAFIGHEQENILQAVLHGRAAGQLADIVAAPYFREARLLPILAEEAVTLDWHIFVYRPQHHRRTARVQKVFDLLVTALESHLTTHTFSPQNQS